MEKTVVEDLLEKYRSGTVTEEERVLLESWYLSESKKVGEGITKGDLNQSRNRIAESILTHTGVIVDRAVAKRVRLLPRLVAAAAILLITGAGSYFLLHQVTHKISSIDSIADHDVQPGTRSATLTLSNGKMISLNQNANGRLAVQGGMAIIKSADGQLQYRQLADSGAQAMVNTISTKRKEQYEVILADGTKAWLNASSSIKYPSAFTGNERQVAITGEVYFEVAHNAAKPFKVTTATQTIEVLGTHFNVNAYADEPNVKTTLLQGSVKVIAAGSYKIIKPGEQATLSDKHFLISQANTEETVAWKNGYFRFNQEKIPSIMRKLSRWYDIDVTFDGPVPDDEFSGTISRYSNISMVLKALTYYKTVHFKIEGRRVIVSK